VLRVVLERCRHGNGSGQHRHVARHACEWVRLLLLFFAAPIVSGSVSVTSLCCVAFATGTCPSLQ
jgi:hypothetical protein